MITRYHHAGKAFRAASAAFTSTCTPTRVQQALSATHEYFVVRQVLRHAMDGRGQNDFR